MRRFWQGLAIFAALLVAVAVALWISPPTTITNNWFSRLAKEATGRDVEIKGRPSLRLSPAPTLRLQDVTLLNPPQMQRAAFLHADAVEIEPTLSWSSFWPRVAISTVRLEAPKLSMSIDRQGHASWQGLGQPATDGGKSAAATGAKLPQVILKDGTIAYADLSNGQSLSLERIQASIVQSAADGPVDAVFETIVRSERVEGRARLPALRAMLGSEPVQATVTLVAAPARAEIDARVERGESPKLSGKTKLDVASMAELAKWLGLETTAAGSDALSFSGELAVAQVPPATGKPATEATAATTGVWQLSVSNGRLELRDGSKAPHVQVEQIVASVKGISASEPIEASADITYNSERIEAHAMLQSLASLVDRAKPSKSGLSLRLASARGQLQLDGDLHPGRDAAFTGRAKGATGSLRGLAGLVNVGLPVEGGLEQTELEGEVSVSADVLKLWNARLRIDETTARGAMSFDRSGPHATRPVIGGSLTLDRLDVGRYFPGMVPAKPQGKGAAPSAPGSAAGGSAGPGAADATAHNPFAVLESVSLKDTLRSRLRDIERGGAPAAQTEAPSAAGAGWNDAVIDLGLLQALDMDLDVKVDEVKVDKRIFVVPSLKSVLKDGRLALEGRDIGTFGGKLSGKAVVDSKPATPTVQASMKAEGLEVDQVLADLGVLEFFSGKAAVEADLTASGKSERALVASLSGRIKTAAERSAVVGWDLRTGWRSIIDRFRRGLGLSPPNTAARTPVDLLTAELSIDKGVVETREAQVRGPHFSASGEGKARLLARDVDFRGTFSTFIAPRLEVPFRASGPWSSVEPGLDTDRFGIVQGFKALINILTAGNGGALESTGAAAAVDPELADLVRRYGEAVEARGSLSAGDAAQLRQLRGMLGPAKP